MPLIYLSFILLIRKKNAKYSADFHCHKICVLIPRMQLYLVKRFNLLVPQFLHLLNTNASVFVKRKLISSEIHVCCAVTRYIYM